jgi:hypothetical protein
LISLLGPAITRRHLMVAGRRLAKDSTGRQRTALGVIQLFAVGVGGDQPLRRVTLRRWISPSYSPKYQLGATCGRILREGRGASIASGG